MTLGTLLVLSILTNPVLVVSVRGQVELEASPTNQPVTRFMKIPEGSTLITQDNAYLSLRFESGSLLRVGPNSKIELQEMTQQNPAGNRRENIRLLFGRVWARVMKLVGKNAKFEVRTQHAVAGVRGTAFWAASDPTGDSFVVDYGAIELTQAKTPAITLRGSGATAMADTLAFSREKRATHHQLQKLRSKTGGERMAAIGDLRETVRRKRPARATPSKPKRRPTPTKFNPDEVSSTKPESELGNTRDKNARIRVKIRGL